MCNHIYPFYLKFEKCKTLWFRSYAVDFLTEKGPKSIKLTRHFSDICSEDFAISHY
jgi:hypothetical protein